MKNIIIYTHMSNFSLNDGGTVVQYYLGKILDEEYKQNVRMFPSSGIKLINPIFSKFYNNDFPIDDNTIVIYCEGTIGNPLQAKYVVRWMLSKLGQNVPYDWLYTWGPKELVYYFNSEEKIASNPEKIGNIYKLLNIIYIDPIIVNYKSTPRQGTCFTVRKGHSIHSNHTIPILHSPDSFEITRQHTQIDYIKIFNNHEYFISYDSITFLYIIAALCGCMSIVVPVNGLSKQDWLNTTVLSEYFKESEEKVLYGVAYGMEEIEFAKNTIHLVKDQWNKIIKFSKDKYITKFIDDINNWDNNLNTIESNF